LGSYRWKLILLLGIPFCLMQFLALIIFQELEKTERFRIRKQLQTAFLGTIKAWEQGFDGFVESEADRLCREYDKTGDVRDISAGDSYLFFVGGLKGVQQTKPEPMDPFSLAFMELYAPQIFTYCPNAPVESEAEIKPYYSTTSKQLLEAFGSDKMRLGRNFFEEEARARFHFMDFGLSAYSWLWNTFGSGSEMRLFFAMTHKKDLVRIYAGQKGLELLEQIPGLWLSFSTEDGYFEVKPESQPELAGFENLIWSVLSESKGVLADVKIGDSDFVGMIVDSRFLDANFAALLPEKLAYSEIFILRKYFRLVQFLFTIAFLLAALWFGQLILSVLSRLKNGFKALIAENYAVRLMVKGKDERAVVLSGFNYMAQGIEEREKLLPFVAGQILNLFRDEAGIVKERVTDQACVLFSDVRSFTTISEKLSPSEIVEMLNEYFTLWQTVVERHNGVIVQFIGDAVVVVFLNGLDDNYRQSAIFTAIDFCREFAVWNEDRQKRGLLTVKNGIGLSCGEIIFSIFGDEHKKQLQAIGEAMHRSEALEAESKFNEHGSILLAGELAETARSLNLSIAEHHSDSGFASKAWEIG
jgi:class 3 adenylate cyclase